MSPRHALAALLVSAAVACAEHDAAPGERSPAVIAEELRQLHAAIEELRARPEHHDPEVTIQHLLVGVKGNLPPEVTRSKAEAETLTAELLARVRAGEDFDTLVKNYTNDSHPGIYVLSSGEGDPPRVFARRKMVPAFGDVAWRLAVGQIGVAAYDGDTPAQKSPFGYHIVKRLK